MDEKNLLAQQFEANRNHLRAVAYRMLGSGGEADDAVQEAWLRLSRTDTAEVGNLGGWLTTVVARICLDVLRARKSRREEPLGPHVPEPVVRQDNLDQEAVMADSVGAALLVVLETLAPAERLAFVLHDMFAMPFEDIAPVVGRSVVATRQLASRARRRVQGTAPAAEADIAATAAWSTLFSRQRAAATSPRCSKCSIPISWSAPILSRCAWDRWRKSEVLPRWPKSSRAARRPRGQRWWTARWRLPSLWGVRLRIVLKLTLANDRIAAMEAIAEPGRLGEFDVEILGS